MKRWEVYIYGLIISLMSLSLISDRVFESLIFLPEAVIDGQFWRIFTHPFVHVSWYHLFIDATAFFLLYMQLEEDSWIRRTVYVSGCGIFSLLATIAAFPVLESVGYCGLSGIGHGLMAVCSLELIASKTSDKTIRQTGILCLGLVTSKCLYEVFTGQMVFSFFHSDMIGCPIAASHAGGLIGGVIMYVFFNGFSFVKSKCLNPESFTLEC